MKYTTSTASHPPRFHVYTMAVIVGFYLLCLAAVPAEAASSLTNSLTAYTGTSQDNYPAQAAFLAGSGLEASFVWGGGAGAWEKIGFGSSGASFGSFRPGADGRNYLRTTDNLYAPVNFTAYVTVDRTTRQSVFFGMGTGAVIAPVGRFVYQGREAVLSDAQAGPVARRLFDALTGIQYGRHPDPYGWTRTIEVAEASSAAVTALAAK